MSQHIWVAYAATDQQFMVTLTFVEGMTAADAIEQSQIQQHVELVQPLQIGIFGVKATLETRLKAGDRVEIYRPLLIHPQDIRRKRAQKHPVGRLGRAQRNSSN